MGQIHKTLPVKLIISIFTRANNSFDGIEEILSKKFGPIDFSSQVLDFNHTRYYAREFGPNLKRKFISFKKLADSGNLWKIKIQTNRVEDKLAKNDIRQFNIDPGYITQANLILASTKAFSHRIYIRNGIYQEVTLIFRNKTFQALPWTFPDYQSKECVDIFIKIRDILNSQHKPNARLPQLSKKL